jgi:glycosyltransferase involved in cell wall biosynthesis
LFFVVLWKRLCWYKTVYVHYSYIWAIVSSLLMRISGGTTYYRSCWMMRLFWKNRLLQIALKMVNYLVTGVHVLMSWYAKHYGISQHKIKIMPNRIELHRLSSIHLDKQKLKDTLWFASHDKIVLFVHRLAERKGAHYIAPIAQALQSHPSIKLLVIGDGPYKETLLQQINAWKLTNITYIGKVPNKDVYTYFSISDVFFMPSEEEWFPRVLLESMACNVPYVAADIWWVKEISPPWQQKYIYEIWDVQWFSKGIVDILQEKFDYRDYIKQYDISEVKKIFIKLINR